MGLHLGSQALAETDGRPEAARPKIYFVKDRALVNRCELRVFKCRACFHLIFAAVVKLFSKRETDFVINPLKRSSRQANPQPFTHMVSGSSETSFTRRFRVEGDKQI